VAIARPIFILLNLSRDRQISATVKNGRHSPMRRIAARTTSREPRRFKMPENESKYELLLDESIEVMGTKLFRIRAKCSFGSIETGEKGGYIEAEKNLSQENNAWVAGDAGVSGDAWVSGDARVSGDAWVSKPSDMLVVGPIGSRSAFLTVIIPSGKASTGCFSGSLDELEEAAKKNDGQDYLDLLPGIRAIVARRKAVV
jgi:hypothetical protein